MPSGKVAAAKTEPVWIVHAANVEVIRVKNHGTIEGTDRIADRLCIFPLLWNLLSRLAFLSTAFEGTVDDPESARSGIDPISPASPGVKGYSRIFTDDQIVPPLDVPVIEIGHVGRAVAIGDKCSLDVGTGIPVGGCSLVDLLTKLDSFVNDGRRTDARGSPCHLR